MLYTIDALLAEGKRLVFAADRAPQALDGVEQRLLAACRWVSSPTSRRPTSNCAGRSSRSKLARFAPLEVPADVIEFLARTINRNVRELVGGLNKLIAYAQLTGQEVSLQLAEEQLTDILSANRKRITIDEIQRTVCQFYRVDRSEMSSKRRARAGGAAAAGGDVPRQGAHPAFVPRDRAQVRRARPLDGDPRGAADRGPPGSATPIWMAMCAAC